MTALEQALETLMCNQAYMVGVVCPSPDWDRFNVSEKLCVTAVVLVDPMVTMYILYSACLHAAG